MTVLKQLQHDVAATMAEAVAASSGGHELSVNLRLSFSQLTDVLSQADDPIILREALQGFVNERLNNGWLWLNFSEKDSLASDIKKIIAQEMYSCANMLRSELRDLNVQHINALHQVNQGWEVRLSKLEKGCEEMAGQMLSAQAEIERLQQENQFLLEKLREYHRQHKQQKETLSQLRSTIQYLEKNKVEREAELVVLRQENKRLREMVSRFEISSESSFLI